VIARGDARKLKREVGGEHLYVVVTDADQLTAAARVVAGVVGEEPDVDAGAASIAVPTSRGLDVVVGVAAALRDAAIAVDDLGLRQPTLDEVFLTLTGSVPDDASGLDTFDVELVEATS
jgi:ABC-2 type transport system ATP-binding protein